ncbi:22694_t:CDS:2, partial [Gigaspora rosea]
SINTKELRIVFEIKDLPKDKDIYYQALKAASYKLLGKYKKPGRKIKVVDKLKNQSETSQEESLYFMTIIFKLCLIPRQLIGYW